MGAGWTLTQEVRDDFQKIFRSVNVNPVSGIGNSDDFGPWKHFFNERQIFVRDIIGSAAANETGRLWKSVRWHDRLRQLVIIV